MSSENIQARNDEIRSRIINILTDIRLLGYGVSYIRSRIPAYYEVYPDREISYKYMTVNMMRARLNEEKYQIDAENKINELLGLLGKYVQYDTTYLEKVKKLGIEGESVESMAKFLAYEEIEKFYKHNLPIFDVAREKITELLANGISAEDLKKIVSGKPSDISEILKKKYEEDFANLRNIHKVYPAIIEHTIEMEEKFLKAEQRERKLETKQESKEEHKVKLESEEVKTDSRQPKNVKALTQLFEKNTSQSETKRQPIKRGKRDRVDELKLKFEDIKPGKDQTTPPSTTTTTKRPGQGG